MFTFKYIQNTEGYTITGYEGVIKGITEIHFPAYINNVKVTQIRESALTKLYDVTDIYIPETVNKLGDDKYINYIDAPRFNDRLCYIHVDPANKTFTDIDGVLYSKDLKFLIKLPTGRQFFHYQIPVETSHISEQAFAKQQKLEDIDISGITHLGAYAFAECTSLKHIDLSSIDFMENGIFYGCTSLEKVYIPSYTDGTFNETFAECTSLREVTIDSPTAYISGLTFLHCPALQHVNITPSNLKYAVIDDVVYQFPNIETYSENVLSTAGFMLIIYPGGKPERSYTIPENTTYISDGALSALPNLSELNIAKNCNLEGRYIDQRKIGIIKRYNIDTELESRWTIGNLPPRIHVIDENLKTCSLELLYTTYRGVLHIPQEIDGYTVTEFNPRILNGYENCTQIIYPSTLTKFHTGGIGTLEKLKNIDSEDSKKQGKFITYNDTLMADNEILYFPRANTRKRIIYKGITLNITDEAFYENQNLKDIIFDSKIGNIGHTPFENAHSIQNILFMHDIENLGPDLLNKITENYNCIFNGHIKEINGSILKKARKGSIYTRFQDNAETLKEFVEKYKKTSIQIYLLTEEEMNQKIMEIYPEYFKSIKSTKISKPADYIEPNKLIIVADKFKCIHNGHTLQDRRVKIRFLDEDKMIRDYAVNVGYCIDCNQYYMLSTIFENNIRHYIFDRGWELIGSQLRYLDHSGYHTIGYNFLQFGEVRTESILKKCGYQVGYSSPLSDSQRMYILNNIIKKELCSRQAIMSYLNYFIKITTPKNCDMSKALRDWKMDLLALDNY